MEEEEEAAATPTPRRSAPSFDTQTIRVFEKFPATTPASTPTTVSVAHEFNVDSNECTLKALDIATESPYALAFLRDDCYDFKDTDDQHDGPGEWVTSNFQSIAAVTRFFEATIKLFGEAHELLANDTPRRPAVIVYGPSLSAHPGAQKESFKRIATDVARAMADVTATSFAAADYYASHIDLKNRDPYNAFVLVHATGPPIPTAEAHASYAAAVSARFAASGACGTSVMQLWAPHDGPYAAVFTELVGCTSYVRFPCYMAHPHTSSARDRPFRARITLVKNRDGTFTTFGAPLDGHFLTAGPRPAGAPLSYSAALAYGTTHRPSLDYAPEWRLGLAKLNATLSTDMFCYDATEFAAGGGATAANTYGRIAIRANSACPLCKCDADSADAPCTTVYLRMMRYVGLRAECDRARIVVGPVLAARFGTFTDGAESRAINITKVVDATGKHRVAPVSSYYSLIPPGHAILHAAQPDSGKTYAARRHLLETMASNMTEPRVYFMVSPTQTLAENQMLEFNKLFRTHASPDLVEACESLYPYGSASSLETPWPCRYYDTTKSSDLYSGGVVSTTVHSFHKYAALFENYEAPIGFLMLDENEKLWPTAMDPKLATSSRRVLV